MPAPPTPTTPRCFWQGLSLTQLQRLRQWRAVQREQRQSPLECAAWEGILTVWMLGWTAWLPAMALDLEPLLPLCVAGMLLPQMYAYARWRAHARQRLRCDWLDLIQ